MLEIRRAVKDDVDELCRVDDRAFGSGPYAEFSDRHKPADWREKRRAGTRERCENHYGETFVALVDGRVAGYVSYRPVEAGVGAIHTTATDPDFQGRGISTALVARVVDELIALGAEKITVHTAHVPAAVRVYEKAGFRVVKRSPAPAINVWLELDARERHRTG